MRVAFDPRAVPGTLQAPPPPRVPDVQLEPVAAAHLAGLRYVNDRTPGIRRRAHGKAFRYIEPTGQALRDEAALARIRSLAIPPAWQDVWICPQENGHIQATGRDAHGRKQYLYHAEWSRVRDANKFARMAAFGRALRRIRRRVGRDLGLNGMPRAKVLAVVVRLLDTTLIRVGNRAYAKENGSYGLTTLRSRHVDVSGRRIRFEFRGKSGIAHQVEIAEARLARIVRRLLELPGQELFHYVGDDGAVHGIDSADVNAYLREIGGEDYSAKDFRTWYATLAAMQALERCERCTSRRAACKEVTRVLREVAKTLGNTPAICRKSYVHPIVIESYLAGCLPPAEGSNAPALRLQQLLTTSQRRRASAAPAGPAREARDRRSPATGARTALNRA